MIAAEFNRLEYTNKDRYAGKEDEEEELEKEHFRSDSIVCCELIYF